MLLKLHKLLLLALQSCEKHLGARTFGSRRRQTLEETIAVVDLEVAAHHLLLFWRRNVAFLEVPIEEFIH